MNKSESAIGETEMIYACKYSFGKLCKQNELEYQRIIADKLLSFALKRNFDLNINEINIKLGTHGKPYIENSDIHYNISHCSGIVCLSLGKTESGIDVDKLRPYNERLAGKVCTSAEICEIEQSENGELMFMKFWTLKESYVKLIGLGLSFGTKNIEFSLKEKIPKITNINEPDIQIFQQVIDDEFVLSCCVKSEVPERIEVLNLDLL